MPPLVSPIDRPFELHRFVESKRLVPTILILIGVACCCAVSMLQIPHLAGYRPIEQLPFAAGLIAAVIGAIILWRNPAAMQAAGQLLVAIITMLVAWRISVILFGGALKDPSESMFRPVWAYIPLLWASAYIFMDRRKARIFCICGLLLLWAVVAYATLPVWRVDPTRQGLSGLWIFLIFGNGVFLLAMHGMSIFSSAADQVNEELQASRKLIDMGAQLKESYQRLNFMQAGSRDGFWDWPDMSTNEQWWSPRVYELLGYTSDELPASLQSFEHSLLHPDDRERAMEEMRYGINSDNTVEAEFRFKTKAGEYRWFSIRGIATTNEAGKLLRMAGSVRDIHDFRSAIDSLEIQTMQLEAAYRDMERFASAASHDLKEPLRGVSMMASRVSDRAKVLQDDELQRFSGKIMQRTDDMTVIVESLLTLAKIDRELPAPTAVNMHKVLRQALVRLSTVVKERQAVVEIDAMPQVEGHLELLVQVFQNLIANAIKFQPQSNPVVKITAVDLSGFWGIEVSDRGIGIDPRYRKKIFEPFARLHTRTQYPGVGMGLAMVRRIVNIHGGSVEVESVPNEGTTFRITLPKAAHLAMLEKSVA